MNPAINSLRSLALLVTGLWTLTTSGPAAAPFGMVDPTFNPPRFTARCYPYRCYSDGRGGLLWSYINIPPENFAGANEVRVGGLVRTTTDGVLDSTFNVGPDLREALGVVVQSDGKILVGGRWVGDVAFDGSPNYRVFRLLPSGALDRTYHSPIFATVPRFLTLQPDGLALVVCSILNVPTANGGIPDFARLNTDGSLDWTFHRPTFTWRSGGISASAALDPNGSICVVGGFDSVDGQPRTQVARLFANGTLDPSFVPSGFKCIGRFKTSSCKRTGKSSLPDGSKRARGEPVIL